MKAEQHSRTAWGTEESSSSSHSSLGDSSTVQLRTSEDKGLRGLHKENSALRDELTTSKSTILHLIHELNQAKCQQAKPSVSHSSGKLPGNAPNSPLQTQMSSTHWNLEGSPSAAAPDYSPDSKASHVQDAMTNGNGGANMPAYRCHVPTGMLHYSNQEASASPVALEQCPGASTDHVAVQLAQTRAYAFGGPGQSPASKANKSPQPARPTQKATKAIGTGWLGTARALKVENRVGSGVHEGVVGSTTQQLRLRDSMLADLRSQNKALADQLAQYIQEQRQLQGQLDKCKGLKDHNARLARQLKEAMAERQMAKTESKALHTQLEKLQKQSKHGSNKTALAKEQVRAYEAKLASKTDMLERLYDCLTALQQQYELNREDGLYWQQTAQATATQLALTETELAQARTEVREANEHMEYLSKQWTEMHADLLTERDLHEVSLARSSSRNAPVTTKHRRQTTDSSTSPPKRSSATAPTAPPLQGHASRLTEPTSRQPEAAAPRVSPHPSPSTMHWSPRLSQSVTANVSSPTGSIPQRTGQGLTATSVERQNMSTAHSRQGSGLAMPQVDREHLVMPHTVSSSRAVLQSPYSPEAQYSKMYPRPTQATSTSRRGGLQCSPEAASKGECHDSLIRAKQSGLHASLQDAGNMAGPVEARGVIGSPSQARRARTVSASIVSPSHERGASKGNTGIRGRGAGGEVVQPGHHAEKKLGSQLQAAQQELSRAAQLQQVLQQQLNYGMDLPSHTQQQALLMDLQIEHSSQIVRQLETQADADVQAIQGRQVQSVAATQAQQSVPIQVAISRCSGDRSPRNAISHSRASL